VETIIRHLEDELVFRKEILGLESTQKNIAGLPVGIFAYQKFHFGCFLEGLGMENVGIFYGHLVYFCSHLLNFVVVI
jgi:hypothetical protein